MNTLKDIIGGIDMEIERLKRGTYNKHNQNFSKSEDSWENIGYQDAKELVKANYQNVKISRPKEDLSAFEWENVVESLDEGRVVHLLKGFLRKKTDKVKCPYCGSSIIDRPAISRRGNSIKICSVCGMRESLEDFTGVRGD